MNKEVHWWVGSGGHVIIRMDWPAIMQQLFKKIHGVWSLESGVWTPAKEVLGVYVLLCTLIICLTTEARLSGDHLDSPWPLLQSPSKAKAKAKAKFTKQPNQEDSESLFVGLQIG